MGKSDKLYSKSPALERDDKGKVSVKQKEADKEDMGLAGNPLPGTPGEMPVPEHTAERMQVKHRHVSEHLAMHHRHEAEHLQAKGDKHEVHARHETELKEMHGRHEKEIKGMHKRHEGMSGKTGGEEISKIESDKKE